jgi:membrane-associated phospholipid phosphatase
MSPAAVQAVRTSALDARQATREVAAGDPGPAARRWLGPLCLVALALFIVNTYLVLTSQVRPGGLDLPITRFVQAFPWGPLTYLMNATNITSGVIQDGVAVIVVIALLVYDRRAGYLMALGAIATGIDLLLKLTIQRPRPTAGLVTILNTSSGYSYPSGHAVFFTWMYFMLAAALSPKVAPRLRPLLWISAWFLILMACLGRVWAGAHWPSDVAGGFLLALAWSAFVLWLPERWLPSPSWHWVRWGRTGKAKVAH